MWSRPPRRRRAAAPRECASLASRRRHRRLVRHRCLPGLSRRRLAPQLICEPALVVGLAGAGLVVPSPA
jgi:hypothetical protein